MDSQTLSKDIANILALSSPTEKAAATRALVARLPLIFDLAPRAPFPLSDIPGREEHPILVPPAQVQKRNITRGTKGRFALLHALAHIELNAINLALDIALRFGCGHCESEGSYVPLFHSNSHVNGFRSRMTKRNISYPSRSPFRPRWPLWRPSRPRWLMGKCHCHQSGSKSTLSSCSHGA